LFVTCLLAFVGVVGLVIKKKPKSHVCIVNAVVIKKPLNCHKVFIIIIICYSELTHKYSNKKFLKLNKLQVTTFLQFLKYADMYVTLKYIFLLAPEARKLLICYRPLPASCYIYLDLVHVWDIVTETKCYAEQFIKS
jgi:hypothetical protein